MVLDNVKFHHAKRLKPVLERYSHRIELVFLLPHSPGLESHRKSLVVNEKEGYT
ncbi:hypothetical protein EZS27_023214 [termite gut metagenome]|uniref:Tc1-like transposase DDE domain-containing protein n=1 Tax=termite gut metagenome TaxID=433724 RepID=A0A5J4R3H8_9ZZZZ